MKKSPAVIGIVFASFIFLTGCATDVGYLWKQGGYLLRYSSGARSIDSILEDPTTTPDTRTFLLSVKTIKSYAVNDIGLKENDNYTRYKEVDRDYMVNVVQACDAVSFNAYQWSYPFLGKLPYKGFYEPEDAKAEADRLKKQGFDVIVRKADAFSTLGFWSDPLYSFMKRYSPFVLASLIIHEQTHATVFIKGESQFNEELAQFVGEEGAFEYLRATYGPGSEEYRDAVAQKTDSDLFLDFLKELSTALEAVYSSGVPRELKLVEKARIITEYKVKFKKEYAPRFSGKAYREAADLPLNNAYISLYDLYTRDIPLIRRYFVRECGSDLKAFMRKVEELSKTGGSVISAMQKELALSAPNSP